MPVEITVPRLGWSMEEAIFSSWLKSPGEAVRAGEMLFAIESDKATQEVESFDAGLLHIPANGPQPGDTVVVGQLIGYLLAEGEGPPGKESGVRRQASESEVPCQPASALTTPDACPLTPSDTTPVSTPRARRVAGELGIDWSRVPGTGRGGRIREADVRNAAATKPSSPLSATRRVIAERMTLSRQNTVPVTLHTTADASALVRLRNEFKSTPDTAGIPLPSYNDMLVKLAAAALQKHAVLNSRWDGDHLLTLPEINIGIAVDTDAGLLVPVIHGVTKLSLRDVAALSRDLIERTRSRHLSPAEFRGGTFTITSLGSFGIDAFNPVINYPECAILGVGRILHQPVAVGEAIALRDMITLSLTFDHRAFDGAPAARFLQTLVRLIESPLAVLQA